MLYSESEAPLFKQWIIRRLEHISDADSDVLADYVLALTKGDDPPEQMRAACVENLQDFLTDNTAPFINEVFDTLQSKSYLPGRANAKPATENSARKRNFQEHDSDASNMQDHQQRGGGPGVDRKTKQMKRGGGGRRGGMAGPQHQPQGMQPQPFGQALPFIPNQQPPMMPHMGSPPHGFPSFDMADPNNPFAAMHAMGFPPQMQQPYDPSQVMQGGQYIPQSPQPGHMQQKCPEYEFLGVCMRGTGCQFLHDAGTPTSPPTQYGAIEALLDEIGRLTAKPGLPVPNGSFPLPATTGDLRGTEVSGRSRGSRGRGQTSRGGRGSHETSFRGGRAAFSSTNSGHNQRNTTVVVEQIPQEHLSNESVQQFFSEFGQIENINLQPQNRLAILKFADHASAQRAFESPKVIFDNRFVKLYWYKPENKPGQDRETSKEVKEPETPQFDPEEFAKKQAEAQRAHEERRKKQADVLEQRKALDDQVRAQAEERARIMKKLAAKTGSGSPASPSVNGSEDNNSSNAATNGTSKPMPSSQNENLHAKLAALQAEAKSLGLNPEDSTSSSPGPQYTSPYPFTRGNFYRGRGGGYRGRGGFGRGAYRGGAFPQGAVARLDNRPRNVSVSVVEAEDGQEVDFGDGEGRSCDSIKSFMMNKDVERKSLTSHPDPQPLEKPIIVVTFEQRYIAEKFIDECKKAGEGAGPKIPGLGNVELGWVANDRVGAAPKTPTHSVNGGEGDKNVEAMNGVEQAKNGDAAPVTGDGATADVSMKEAEKEWDPDVAEDEEGWIR